MAYAHNKGIIHRDLKPQNIMVDNFGVVLVLDWGLAKNIKDTEDNINATIDGQIKGSPNYMSPEQASGKLDAIDERADVFALGVILFRIITGKAHLKERLFTKW